MRENRDPAVRGGRAAFRAPEASRGWRDSAELAYTVVGRATGTTQLVGIALVTTTSVDSVLTVRNPAGNAAALTVTPLSGGTSPISAHLTIVQLQ